MPGWAIPGTSPVAPVAFPEPPAWEPAAAAGAATDGLPADRTEAVFDRFAAMIRGGLSGCTVIDWSDPELVADAGTDGPPWVRLTPQPGLPEPIANDPEGIVYRCPLEIVIETSASGVDPGGSLSLWRAIQGACCRADPALEKLGVTSATLRAMPWGSALEAKAQSRCVGRGVVELTLYYILAE